ncbi:hypothetical protein CEXT_35171 [Caerostris extrusa]|uniref:Uncharacterized protein n=1 Tax=Caerostris extrusa TaxID=172846 RepID=A0AAV4VS42_CAEEX|nr:hypothetical protein CEXT_35171 [Caerostris extrusa]
MNFGELFIKREAIFKKEKKFAITTNHATESLREQRKKIIRVPITNSPYWQHTPSFPHQGKTRAHVPRKGRRGTLNEKQTVPLFCQARLKLRLSDRCRISGFALKNDPPSPPTIPRAPLLKGSGRNPLFFLCEKKIPGRRIGFSSTDEPLCLVFLSCSRLVSNTQRRRLRDTPRQHPRAALIPESSRPLYLT